MPKHISSRYVFHRADGGRRRDIRGGFSAAVRWAGREVVQRAGEGDEEFRVRNDRTKLTAHTLRR
ncbi:hypothetical protein MYX77_14870, partial [Acidobacteriia bacterium AH_259_A11_L15]|nr:hypothetical protein [Acidobacteriia bacterium AH_259_A11_L15]